MKIKSIFVSFLISFSVYLASGNLLAYAQTTAQIPQSQSNAKSSTGTLPPITSITQPSPVQPQPVDFSACNKSFKLDSQKLFYLTLAAVNANRFTIAEIQSKSGYILFSVGQRQFLATIINVDNSISMLKITPCNNVYYFPIGIVQNMFKYIELNINTPIEKLGIL